jgi:hypothetical protein
VVSWVSGRTGVPRLRALNAAAPPRGLSSRSGWRGAGLKVKDSSPAKVREAMRSITIKRNAVDQVVVLVVYCWCDGRSGRGQQLATLVVPAAPALPMASLRLPLVRAGGGLMCDVPGGARAAVARRLGGGLIIC